MLSDLREHEDGASFEADLCIIGAGAAGISIAREFVGTRWRLLVVESGGREFEEATQDLYKGPSNMPEAPIDVQRLRMFGGSTVHWGGNCRPLDEADFLPRDWVPRSGWPFPRAELDAFYARAQAGTQLGPYRYDAGYWSGLGMGLIGFDPERIVNRLWQTSDPPLDFGQAYGAELEGAGSIHVLLHANAVALETNAAGTEVTGVRLRTLEGRAARARARAYVLACGGIENARLLLAWMQDAPAGIGGRSDLVGRFFMDHPHALMAMAITDEPIARFAGYVPGVTLERTQVFAKPGISPAVQEREKLLNACADLGIGGDRSEGYVVFARDMKTILRGGFPEDFGGDLLAILGDFDGLVTGAYRRITDRSVLWFATNAEQVPNPDSRVTLAAERDALGLPRARLDWRLTEFDKRSIRRTCQLIGEELARLGLARMRLDRWLVEDDATWLDLTGRNHHLGTTRMHDDAKQGVVDRDGKLHGVANFYVAGSSVFPTSGYANPTLTVVALALRLADHLKRTWPAGATAASSTG